MYVAEQLIPPLWRHRRRRGRRSSPLVGKRIVAYQTLHRSAQVKPEQTALLIGASGGIGTALLQLGLAAGLRMYGLASPSKHAALIEYGATPIDYRTQDFVPVIRQMEPGGLDAVFDGMGGDYLPRGFGLLKRGGVWVSYANPRSLAGMFRLLGRVLWYNLRPDGRRVTLYGTGASNLNRRPFLEDWATLFRLLARTRSNRSSPPASQSWRQLRPTPCSKAGR